MSWHRVPDDAALARVLAGPPAAVPVRGAGHALILTRDEHGTLRALENECPHQGATICREAVTGQDTLECPNHFWLFDLEGTFEGSRLAVAAGRTAPQDPAKDLATHACRVVDGGIEVEL